MSRQRLSGAAAMAEVTYHGGPVVHSSDPFLVYWIPPGESIPTASQSLLERYLTDASADSGEGDDVFAVDRQYYDRSGFADYRQTFDAARQVVIDQQPYPARDTRHCVTPTGAYRTCISDGQLQAQLKRLIEANGLPTAGSPTSLSANAPVYFVILPTDVDICIDGGLMCAENSMCAYHNAFALRHGETVLYAAIPAHASFTYDGLSWPKICQNDGSAAVQEPNGDIADMLIGLLSHEYSETITDPISPTPSGTIVPRITPPRGRIDARTSLRFTPEGSTSTHPQSSATWSFGDGSLSSFFTGRKALTPATHDYAAPGRYTITLTLVDSRGNVQSTSRAITVLPPACVVPNVKGKSKRRATEAIRAAHCAVAKLTIPDRRRRARSKLLVAHQSPRAGAVRPRGTKVSLTLVFVP